MAQQPTQGLLPLPNPPQSVQAVAPAAGRGRGNRRQGGRGRGQRQDVNVRPPRIPNLQPPVGPPRPSHLQTVGTPERNDPLWTTGVAGSELQPLPHTEYIYPGAEVLPLVTSVVHSTCTASSASFARRVPESALAYYCAVATYTRFLRLQTGNGLEVSADEERFVEQVDSLQLEIPMLLAHYLAGFGNTRVPSGRDVRFRLRNRPEYVNTDLIRGWFGQISPETQSLYQNYPCLAVYAARIQADSDADEDRRWNFPLALHPATPGGVGPSVALVGYAPKAVLSATQRSFLEACDVYADEIFPSVNRSLPLNIDLLIAVQNELNNVPQVKLSAMPVAMVGSQAQLGKIRCEDELVPLIAKPAIFE